MATAAVLDAVAGRLRSCGAEVIDPVPLPGVEQMWELEVTALLAESSTGSTRISAPCRRAPEDSRRAIDFNARHATRCWSTSARSSSNWRRLPAATSATPRT